MQISMGKMAHLLNIEKKQVRIWAREFNINNLADQSENQIRQAIFSQADLVTFKLIKKLIFQENYTTEQVKNYFSATPEMTSPKLRDPETSPSDVQKYTQATSANPQSRYSHITDLEADAARTDRATLSHPLILSLSKDQAEDHPLNQMIGSMHMHRSPEIAPTESHEIALAESTSSPALITAQFTPAEIPAVSPASEAPSELNREISLSATQRPQTQMPQELRSQLLDLQKKLVHLRQLL